MAYYGFLYKKFDSWILWYSTQKILNMLHASSFSFIILNLVKKVFLDFYVTTATLDLCMKEAIDSLPCIALWRKIMDTLKAKILTVIVLNLVF